VLLSSLVFCSDFTWTETQWLFLIFVLLISDQFYDHLLCLITVSWVISVNLNNAYSRLLCGVLFGNNYLSIGRSRNLLQAIAFSPNYQTHILIWHIYCPIWLYLKLLRLNAMGLFCLYFVFARWVVHLFDAHFGLDSSDDLSELFLVGEHRLHRIIIDLTFEFG